MDAGAALSLRDIAQRQQISLDYLEQIVPALKSAGLIKSKRGAQGGYFPGPRARRNHRLRRSARP